MDLPRALLAGALLTAGTPYLGVDYFVLDLLKSSLAFVTLERLLPLQRAQPVFREAWRSDLAWFARNHAGVGALLRVINALAHASARALAWSPLGGEAASRRAACGRLTTARSGSSRPDWDRRRDGADTSNSGTAAATA